MRVEALSIMVVHVASLGAQCVPDPIVTSKIQGRVLFSGNSRNTPLDGTEIKILPYAYAKPAIAETITNAEGAFTISGIRPGRYYLSVRHPALIGFNFEVRLKGTEASADKDIEILLRNDPRSECGGASAKLETPMRKQKHK
jgi:hypothetical protein